MSSTVIPLFDYAPEQEQIPPRESGIGWRAGVERLSFHDESLLGGYVDSIDRLAFAAPYCRGRHVLDAGCGTGLAERYLLDHGVKSVLGVDYSIEAIREAWGLQCSENAEFMVGDLHELDALMVGRRFGAVVSFETLPQLQDPIRFLSTVRHRLHPGGVFIVSTPNRDAIAPDEAGQPPHRFDRAAYTPHTLETLLRGVFTEVDIWGQWLTPTGRLRRQRAEEQFRYLSESYYQPAAKLTRWVKNLLGHQVLPPPENHAGADSYPGDSEIAPIQPARLPWAPTSLIAVCRAI